MTDAWRDVPVPRRIARLPTWPPEGGMPIPFSSYRDDAGKPDFRVVDQARNALIAANRLCAICGLELGRYAAFIGGPVCIEDRMFTDGPMHKECAQYAARVCPYLALVRSYSLRPLEEGMVVSEAVSATPPDRMAYAVTKGWTCAIAADALVYLPDPWEEVVWFREPRE